MAFTVTAWSLAREPLPLALSISLLAGYGALVTAGVLLLPLRVFIDAVLEGPRDARGVALTFDDGPDEGSTRRVLDALDAAGARATFFVIAKKVEHAPELAREILQRGHTIGLHSYAHDRLFSLRREKVVRRDLERGIAVLEATLGARPRWFRPPIGHTNPIIARVAADLDLVTVGWSVSARDGTARATQERSLARVVPRLRDGAIVLMHDAAERGEHTPIGPEMVPRLLAAMAAQNLDVTPLAEWIGPPIHPGGSSTTKRAPPS